MATKYHIKFLSAARSDLESAEAYLTQYSWEAARDFYAALDEVLYSLQTMPYMFQEYDRLPQYRRFIVGRYLVFYRVNEVNKRIVIYRVLHSAQEINRHLKE